MPSREEMAKWLFDYEYQIAYPALWEKFGSTWPKNAAEQPYCRNYFKMATALLVYLASLEVETRRR